MARGGRDEAESFEGKDEARPWPRRGEACRGLGDGEVVAKARPISRRSRSLGEVEERPMRGLSEARTSRDRGEAVGAVEVRLG